MKKLTYSISKSYEVLRQEGFRELLSRIYRNSSELTLKIAYKSKLIRNSTMSVLLLKTHFYILKNLSPSFSDSSPLKLIYVDPSKIIYHYHGSPQQFGEVEAGDWDLTSELFDSKTKYNPIIAKKIKSQGYRSQRDLFGEKPEETWGENNDAIHPYLNEIAVNIGRDGRMGKKSSGGHRLSVAKQLGLDEVPVVVRARHADWQYIRDQIRTTDSIEELPEDAVKYLEHPDLQDLRRS